MAAKNTLSSCLQALQRATGRRARWPYRLSPSGGLPGLLLMAVLGLAGCRDASEAGSGEGGLQQGSVVSSAPGDSLAAESCCGDAPSRPSPAAPSGTVTEWTGPVQDQGTRNMVRIPAGVFSMGASDSRAYPDEYPAHQVQVRAFWMDEYEVTNAEFAAFVEATGYITTAEKPISWEELAPTLPPGTPRLPDEALRPGALVFRATEGAVPLHEHYRWWAWTPGANWRQPEGPGSSIKGRENHPVVQVSWHDARAYAAWAGKRLPTEAEWEWAARGGLEGGVYPWGTQSLEDGGPKANYWEGDFPYRNTLIDGYALTAPVGRYPANDYGLYDMAGNVWEWCQDWYHPDYYRSIQDGADNPQGPKFSFDPDEPAVPKRVLRGGSFLCNDAYCAGYRVAARMKSSPETGLQHSGFRCVRDTAP
jgi:sulfatase modifying factor 1